MKVVVQIDGLSGTGKSSLAAEFSRRRYRAVDSDAEFAYFGEPATGQASTVLIRDHWIWDLGKIRSFCAESLRSPLFICGGALNQDECADLFTHRIMLRIDDDTMRQRLRTRTSNDFGKAPAELAEQLELNRRARSSGGHAGWTIVDATQPVAKVADAILRHIQ